jgi:hypothetical protein
MTAASAISPSSRSAARASLLLLERTEDVGSRFPPRPARLTGNDDHGTSHKATKPRSGPGRHPPAGRAVEGATGPPYGVRGRSEEFVAEVLRAGEDPADAPKQLRRLLEVAESDLGAVTIRPFALGSLDPAEHLASRRRQAG